MIYIITGDRENIYMEIHDDPDFTKKIIVGHWSHGDFEAITGIAVPNDLTQLSYEPHRKIYAIRRNFNNATVFKYPSDNSFIKALHDNIDELRMHCHAAVKEEYDPEEAIYHYDKSQGKIVKQDNPDRAHLLGRRTFQHNYARISMYFIELVKLLIAKGVITLDDLPNDLKGRDLAKFEQAISDIDWSRYLDG
jgi:hypothetical protein